MERIYNTDEAGIEKVAEFLKKQGLLLDRLIDELYVVESKGKIIATGAIYKNVLKCIALDSEHRGAGDINAVMSFLINRAYNRNDMHLFIYTKADTYKSFEYFGFKKIAASENVVLMENFVAGIEHYVKNLEKKQEPGTTGTIVLNCNPFTCGHQFLIETAAQSCDWVHIFILWTDASTFSNTVRFDLVEKGTRHIKNITLHKGTDYIISEATFPSYFIKDDQQVIKEQTALDLIIFGNYIAPALNITKRFVGKEPFNSTTAAYNEQMKKYLPSFGIEVIELDRKEKDAQAISASTVRRLLSQGEYEGIKAIVPESTYTYLISDAAAEVRQALQENFNIKNLV